MPGNIIETVEETIAITDPGEKGRDEHSWLDRTVINIGNVAAWLFPILMVAICTQVVIRKFGFNQAWLDDAQWWIYGAAMLAAFGYSITTESHVRVDIFHQNYSIEKKAKIEIFALGWLLLPFLILMMDITTKYAISSWVAGEGSDSPNGLHRLYLLKALIPVLFGVAILAAISVTYRYLKRLTEPAPWKILLAMLPATWFMAERAVYYVLWLYVRYSQPDLNPRRISREPLLQNTLWIALALLLLAVAVGYYMSKRKTEKA